MPRVFKRRARSGQVMPSRRAIDARLRDRGLDSLGRQRFVLKSNAADVLTPRSRKALEIVQMDHTLVDIMVVDEVLRQSMGRPWITVAFDIATRVVLGFALRVEPPSATSVGLALAMACLPKEQWLKERHLDLIWTSFGVPELVHVDNGKEFHSLALTRGCERHGISLEYRPPGRPQYGGHIERYLGTLMRRIHGVPGTTMSNVKARGRYHSEKHATLSLRELEAWVRSTFVAGLGVGEICRVQVATETGNVTTSGRRALLKATEASNDAAVGRIVEAEMT